MGRVVVKETGAGVAGLVVAVSASAAGHSVGPRGRLGSVATEADGGFLLEYDVHGDVRDGWDLLVTVSAPDDCGTDPSDAVAPLASCRRSDPAPRESYRIRIATDKLIAAGVLREPEELDADQVIASGRALREFRSALTAESRRVLAERFVAGRQVRELADAHFARFLKALSVADGDRPGGRYVPPGASIREAELAAIRDGVLGTINQMSRATVGVFTPEQLALLQERYGEDLSRVPAGAVDEVLWPQVTYLLYELQRRCWVENSLASRRRSGGSVTASCRYRSSAASTCALASLWRSRASIAVPR